MKYIKIINFYPCPDVGKRNTGKETEVTICLDSLLDQESVGDGWTGWLVAYSGKGYVLRLTIYVP